MNTNEIVTVFFTLFAVIDILGAIPFWFHSNKKSQTYMRVK